MINETQDLLLDLLEAANQITAADKNLRSKINSINRSLINLQEKRNRIDFEIRKQKKSLIRKREELKRVSKRNRKNLISVSESGDQYPYQSSSSTEQELRKLDSILLQESDQLLEI